MAYTSILKKEYQEKILPSLTKDLDSNNKHAIPRLERVVINVGVGKLLAESRSLDDIIDSVSRLAGQKPVITLARQSISGFKMREGDKVGLKVTLRGNRMYDFIQRLVHVTLPRVRDFRGISPKSFDGNGNYTIGIKEHTAFPEISPDESANIFGLEVTVITTAKTDKEAKMLLKEMKFPLKNSQNEK